MAIVEQDEVAINEGEELVAEAEVSEEVQPEPDKQTYEIPVKFQDKSLEDVVKSYQELESQYGKRNNEIGDLRKLTDELLGLQLEEKREQRQAEQPAAYSLDVDDLLENPDKAIDIKLDSNPRLQAIEEKLLNQERKSAQKLFESKHPDWQEVLNTPDFNQWVQGSNIRSDMFQKAHKQYDYDMADELFGLYKQVQGAVSQQSAQTKSKQLKQAAVASGSTGAKSTKVYRRTDLVNMRVQNPEGYAAREGEFAQAYAEGRVR